MFWVHTGNTIRGVEVLELRLAGRWNRWVSHYDDSETGNGIRNVRKEKTL